MVPRSIRERHAAIRRWREISSSGLSLLKGCAVEPGSSQESAKAKSIIGGGHEQRLRGEKKELLFDGT
jgi:hypothetical protein